MGSVKITFLIFAVLVTLQEFSEGVNIRRAANLIQRNLIGTLKGGKHHVIIVVDSAGSRVERRNFGTVKSFASALIRAMPLKDKSKLSVISASSRGAINYPLRYFNSRKAIDAVKGIRFGARKDLLGGLNQAIRSLRAARKEHADKVIIQISTGYDRRARRRSLLRLRQCLWKNRIRVYSFVLNRASWFQLRYVTSKPLWKYMLKLRYYRYVRALTSRLTSMYPGPGPRPQPTVPTTQGPQVVTTGALRPTQGPTQAPAPAPTPDPGHPVLDKCNRLCLKIGGETKYCSRVRKDFTSMSSAERARWISAYKKASTTQPFKRDFDKLIAMHKTLFSTSIHTRDEFLPWHRWYILQLENLLRRIDCRVTMPYWDWSLWSHDPWDVKHIWSSSNDGMGGNGKAPDYCVRDGPFAKNKWHVAPSAHSNGQSCLRRDFTGNPPDAPAVQILLKTPANQIKTFEENLRVNFHNRVHCNFASRHGHMCSLDSAAAPDFFLHHGFIDKTWSDYQKISKEHKVAHFAALTTKKMRGTNYTPAELHNLRRQPGGVRVIYSDPTHDHARRLLKVLKGMSVKTLDGLPRAEFSSISKATFEVFHIGNREMALTRKFERKIKPIHVVKNSALHGVNKQLGFIA